MLGIQLHVTVRIKAGKGDIMTEQITLALFSNRWN